MNELAFVSAFRFDIDRCSFPDLTGSCAELYIDPGYICIGDIAELSTGRMDPRVGSGRVGSGRVGSGHDFAGFWRVGSGRVSTSDFLVFYLLFLGT